MNKRYKVTFNTFLAYIVLVIVYCVVISFDIIHDNDIGVIYINFFNPLYFHWVFISTFFYLVFVNLSFYFKEYVIVRYINAKKKYKEMSDNVLIITVAFCAVLSICFVLLFLITGHYDSVARIGFPINVIMFVNMTLGFIVIGKLLIFCALFCKNERQAIAVFICVHFMMSLDCMCVAGYIRIDTSILYGNLISIITKYEFNDPVRPMLYGMITLLLLLGTVIFACRVKANRSIMVER